MYALDEYSGSAQNLAELTLATDNIFSDGWDMQLLTLEGSVDSGYTSAALPVPIDTTTAPTADTVANGGGAPAGDMGTPPAPPTNG